MERLLSKVKSHEVEFVRIETEDIHGISRGFTLDIDYFLRCIDTGIPLCKSTNSFCLHGELDLVSNTGLQDEIDYRNGYLYPDLTTFQVLPWKENTGTVLGDFRLEYKNKDSEYMFSNTRAICKKQIEKLKGKGLQIFGALEYEFYVLDRDTKKPSFDQVNVYATCDTVRHDDLLQNICKNLKKMEIPPELYHIEAGPSQYELTLRPSFGITLPDNAFRFKHLAKEVAATHDNKQITFMSKPFLNSSGCSGHFNHSIWDMNNVNLFHDKLKPNHLSELAEQWLAGLLYHTDALMCLACPTPNCYDRRNAGCFAPAHNLWGFDNRSITYRVKTMGESGSYIENRLPGAAVNPYLITAGSVIAGMDGINKKMKLTMPPYVGDPATAKEFPENMKTLPITLQDSLQCLKSSDLFVEELGENFIQCFTAVKSFEIEKIRNMDAENVRQWYLKHYAQYI